jgi:hypothetical protein
MRRRESSAQKVPQSRASLAINRRADNILAGIPLTEQLAGIILITCSVSHFYATAKLESAAILRLFLVTVSVIAVRAAGPIA